MRKMEMKYLFALLLIGCSAFAAVTTNPANSPYTRWDSSSLDLSYTAGLVGIGTSSPTKQLTVSSNGTTLRGFEVKSTLAAGYTELVMSNSTPQEYRFGVGGSASAVPGNFYLYDGTAGAFRMEMDTNGNLAIGSVLVPETKLDVKGAITTHPYGASSGNTGQVRMKELAANGTNHMILRAADSIGSDFALTFPVDDGTTNQSLLTNGSGTLSWDSASTWYTQSVLVNTTCSSSPCTITRQGPTTDWVTEITGSGGSYQLVIKSGVFSAGPVCTFSGYNNSINLLCSQWFDSATGGQFYCINSTTGAQTSARFSINCSGPR